MSRPEHEEVISVKDYLSSEASSRVRREFVKGQVYAMAGSTQRHNRIAGNFYFLLQEHVKNSPCGAFFEALKVHVEKANCFYYPDIVVACGKLDEESIFAHNPVLIVEVLSRSTSNIDRREKRLNYQLLESLEEYVIVHQNRQQVEVYRREPEGDWPLQIFGSGAEFLLESMHNGPLSLSVSSIYDGTDASPVFAGNLVREEEEEYGFEGEELVAWMEW